MSTNASFLTHQNLLALLADRVAQGTELHAPGKVRDRSLLCRVTDVRSITFEPLTTIESPKSLLFPEAERLLAFERKEGGLTIEDPATAPLERRVVFGTRPCDAIALQRLAAFFAADIPDAFVARRRDALTIISMSCTTADADCFCTSVGAGPGETAGSDILLTPIGGDRYLVECVTERGQELVRRHEKLVDHGGPVAKTGFLATVEPVPGFGGLQQNLAGGFDHPVWRDASLRCLGCGACAYVCPVCSCFTIEDEGTAAHGERLRCWDSCGFALFTLHTSGHNPRPTQSDRWRQRVMHKFAYAPAHLGFPGCVGCGRCSRACPADMNLKEQITTIASRLAEQDVP